jgi:hypothetical protein
MARKKTLPWKKKNKPLPWNKKNKPLPWNKKNKPLPWNVSKSRKKKPDIFETFKHGAIHIGIFMVPFLAAIVILGKLLERIKKQ